MKPNTVYKDVNGVEYAMWPGLYLNTTQGMGNSFSHLGSMSIDDAGKGVGISQYFAPSNVKLRWADKKSGNGLCFESVNACNLADGGVDYYHFVMWHDNNIDDMRNRVDGKTFVQGTKIYDEGTAGNATGNHVHIAVAKGKYLGGYPLVQNEFGVWEIKNEVPPMSVFFIDDTEIIKDMGYVWATIPVDSQEDDGETEEILDKETSETVEDSADAIPEPVEVKQKPATLKVGSRVKFKNPGAMNLLFSTRGRIPSFVRNAEHYIGQVSIDKTKCLLVREVSKTGLITKKGIYSWVFAKDIELV